MSWTLEKDAQFCEDFVEVSEGEKRHIRASSTTYENSGTYFTLKLFKKGECGSFRQNQKITLSENEFRNLAEQYEVIRTLGKTTELNQFRFNANQKKPAVPAKRPKIVKKEEEQQCATQ